MAEKDVQPWRNPNVHVWRSKPADVTVINLRDVRERFGTAATTTPPAEVVTSPPIPATAATATAAPAVQLQGESGVDLSQLLRRGPSTVSQADATDPPAVVLETKQVAPVVGRAGAPSAPAAPRSAADMRFELVRGVQLNSGATGAAFAAPNDADIDVALNRPLSFAEILLAADVGSRGEQGSSLALFHSALWSCPDDAVPVATPANFTVRSSPEPASGATTPPVAAAGDRAGSGALTPRVLQGMVPMPQLRDAVGTTPHAMPAAAVLQQAQPQPFQQFVMSSMAPLRFDLQPAFGYGGQMPFTTGSNASALAAKAAASLNPNAQQFIPGGR